MRAFSWVRPWRAAGPLSVLPVWRWGTPCHRAGCLRSVGSGRVSAWWLEECTGKRTDPYPAAFPGAVLPDDGCRREPESQSPFSGSELGRKQRYPDCRHSPGAALLSWEAAAWDGTLPGRNCRQKYPDIRRCGPPGWRRNLPTGIQNRIDRRQPDRSAADCPTADPFPRFCFWRCGEDCSGRRGRGSRCWGYSSLR